ncbi:MerR family transcriptional regulator [Streptomyces koyangensis]|uniref:MerR family transcriptional regulator n=1 Tax=Streptomyces koyangensis TaxID=188770 RepID=UPI003C2EC0DA
MRALRYYEEHAPLTPDRAPRGQRHYPHSAVARVHLIQQLYTAGLSSRTIHDLLLPCVLDGQLTPEPLHRLTEQRNTLTTKLTTTRDTLDQVIANAEANLRTGEACGGGG